MNLYFFAPTDKQTSSEQTPSQDPIFKTILTTLRDNPRRRVISNLEPDSLARFLKELKINAPLFNAHALDSIDAFVIHHQDDEHELSYILSFALIRKKPLLYLIPKFLPTTPSIHYLKHLQEKEHQLKAVFYHSDTVAKHIQKFCAFLDGYSPQKEANIKFTLRLTQEQHDYLVWRCQKHRATKAEILRDVIQKQLIEPDVEYLKYKKKRERSQ
jgi:hypothetical protein